MNNVALLIDIDNAKVSLPVFEDILKQIKEKGNLIYCKVYGLTNANTLSLMKLLKNMVLILPLQ